MTVSAGTFGEESFSDIAA